MNKMVDLSDMAIAVFGTRFVHQQKIFEGLAKKPDPLMYRQQNRKIQNFLDNILNTIYFDYKELYRQI